MLKERLRKNLMQPSSAVGLIGLAGIFLGFEIVPEHRELLGQAAAALFSGLFILLDIKFGIRKDN